MPGLEPTSAIEIAHMLFGPSGLCVYFKKKLHALHTEHARVTHGTRAHTRMTTYLKPVPAQGRQNCGEPCSCKDILVDKIRSIFEHKATRYLQETREKKGNVCRSWNSRPHTQSRTEASKTGGCFFLRERKKYRIAHGVCTRDTRHTAL